MAAPSPSPVRMFVPDHPALAITARARIETERKILTEQLGGGYASSWEDYKHRAGVIRGLDVALEKLQEVEDEMSERKR